MHLQQRPPVVRVRLVLELAAHEGERPLVLLHLVVRREHEELPVGDVPALVLEERLPVAPARLHVRRAADVGEALHRFAGVEAPRDLPRGELAHAEHHEVRLRVEEDGTADFVRPVVVVRDTPERRLDAADDDGDARERAAGEVRVDEGRAVRARGRPSAGRVLVDRARLLLGGELVQHRVEVARTDADEEARRSHARDVGRRAPVRLRDDADLVAPPLEEARDEDRPEGRVVDVRVAGDDEDVEPYPAARFHLGACRREKA